MLRTLLQIVVSVHSPAPFLLVRGSAFDVGRSMFAFFLMALPRSAGNELRTSNAEHRTSNRLPCVAAAFFARPFGCYARKYGSARRSPLPARPDRKSTRLNSSH